MMANKFILSMVVTATLLFVAGTATADPFLDAAGPPFVPGTASSTFEGDLDDLTGTIILDDMVVAALENLDGSTENLWSSSDNIIGANVYFGASFEDGNLDTDEDSVLKIYDDSVTFFEGELFTADLSKFTIGSNFRMLSVLGVTVTDADVATGESDWIDDLYEGIMGHGMAFFFTAHITSDDPDDEELFHLNNAGGKMTPNPEPVSLALLGAGLVGLAAWRRRKRTA